MLVFVFKAISDNYLNFNENFFWEPFENSGWTSVLLGTANAVVVAGISLVEDQLISKGWIFN